MKEEDRLQSLITNLLRGDKVDVGTRPHPQVIENLITLRAPGDVGGSGGIGGSVPPPTDTLDIYWFTALGTYHDDAVGPDPGPEHAPDFSIAWSNAVANCLDDTPPGDFNDYPFTDTIEAVDGFSIGNNNSKQTAIGNIRAFAAVFKIYWTVKNTLAYPVILHIDSDPTWLTPPGSGSMSDVHLDPDETTDGETAIPDEPANPDITVTGDTVRADTGFEMHFDPA